MFNEKTVVYLLSIGLLITLKYVQDLNFAAILNNSLFHRVLVLSFTTDSFNTLYQFLVPAIYSILLRIIGENLNTRRSPIILYVFLVKYLNY